MAILSRHNLLCPGVTVVFEENEGQPRVFKTQPVPLGSNQPRFGQSQQGMTVGEAEAENCHPIWAEV